MGVPPNLSYRQLAGSICFKLFAIRAIVEMEIRSLQGFSWRGWGEEDMEVRNVGNQRPQNAPMCSATDL